MVKTISDIASAYTLKQEVKRADSVKPPTAMRSAEVEARVPVEKEVEQSERPQRTENTQALSKQVEAFANQIRRDLEFSVDENTGEQVVRVIDSDTGELVRQIPSDQMLHIIQHAREQLDDPHVGVLLDEKL